MWFVYCIPVQVLGSTWLSSFMLIRKNINPLWGSLWRKRYHIYVAKCIKPHDIDLFCKDPLETLPAAFCWATHFSDLGLDTIFSENLAVTLRWVRKKSCVFPKHPVHHHTTYPSKSAEISQGNHPWLTLQPQLGNIPSWRSTIASCTSLYNYMVIIWLLSVMEECRLNKDIKYVWFGNHYIRQHNT